MKWCWSCRAVSPTRTTMVRVLPKRVEMLGAVLDGRARLAAAASVGGLFIEIAHECRAAYGPSTALTFVCGWDAAERIVGWDYGNQNAISNILETFQLLVACREGAYEPPERLRQHVRALALPADVHAISASDVRRSIRAGAAWRHLVPEVIVPMVREIYRPPAA